MDLLIFAVCFAACCSLSLATRRRSTFSLTVSASVRTDRRTDTGGLSRTRRNTGSTAAAHQARIARPVPDCGGRGRHRRRRRFEIMRGIKMIAVSRSEGGLYDREEVKKSTSWLAVVVRIATSVTTGAQRWRNIILLYAVDCTFGRRRTQLQLTRL